MGGELEPDRPKARSRTDRDLKGLRLLQLIRLIAGDDYLDDELVFRGGTCLRRPVNHQCCQRASRVGNKQLRAKV